MEPYTETQTFNQPWLKLAIIIPFVTVISGIIWGSHEGTQTTGLIIAFAVLGLVSALFYFSKLETRIDERGITIRFIPYQRYYYFVGWNELEEAYVRQYKPLVEYGGWGLRFGLKSGKAFNVRGNKGLQLVLKGGAKILIGTQNDVRMQSYLAELKEHDSITAIK